MATLPGYNLDKFKAWISTKPECIQELAAKLPPDRLYRLKDSKPRKKPPCRCTIYSYIEDGTVVVSVTGEYNLIPFSRNVFGIKPEDLEECDLPPPGEEVGDMAAQAGYTPDDVRNILIPEIIKRSPEIQERRRQNLERN